MKKLLIFISFAGLFAILVSSMLFSSCNNEDKKKVETSITDSAVKTATEEEKTTTLVTAKLWPYFKLDRAQIEALIIRPDHQPLKWRKHNRVVLQHSLYGVADDGKVSVKLIGIALDNNPPYGHLREPFEIRDTALWEELPNPVILGNNRLSWYAIGEIIFERSGPNKAKLKADFDYILFKPMVTYDNGQHPGCTMCQGHLWYQMTAYKTDGTAYPGWGGGGSGSTNPSPPAEPGQ